MGSPDANARSPSTVMTVTPPSPIARQDPSDHTAAARSSMPTRITSSDGRPCERRPDPLAAERTRSAGGRRRSARRRAPRGTAARRSPGRRPRISVHAPSAIAPADDPGQRGAGAPRLDDRVPHRRAERARPARYPDLRPPGRRTVPLSRPAPRSSANAPGSSSRDRAARRRRDRTSRTTRAHARPRDPADAVRRPWRSRTPDLPPRPRPATRPAARCPGAVRRHPRARGVRPCAQRTAGRGSAPETYAGSMPSLYEMTADVPFVAPVMVGAFDGWIDASSAATSAAATARRERRGRRAVRRATRSTTTGPGVRCSTWSTARSRGWNGRSSRSGASRPVADTC